MNGSFVQISLDSISGITYWETVLSLLKKEGRVFLAMVVNHTIHSPGTTGAKLLMGENKKVMGTIGGGIMEYNLMARIGHILEIGNFSPEIQTLIHQKSGDGELSGMICAGNQTNLYYLCEPEKDYNTVNEIVGVLKNGKSAILSISQKELSIDKRINKELDFQYLLTQDGSNWLYQEQLRNFNRISIIGGGHCSLALSRVMKNLGYYISVFETRNHISTLELNTFTDKIIIVDDFKEAASQIAIPEQTQVVVMTTDVSSDVRGLLGVLNAPFSFIGVMGSQAKITEIKKRLKIEGISDLQLKRITAPVGLPMVSNTPEEIAISVAAQLLQLKNESTT